MNDTKEIITEIPDETARVAEVMQNAQSAFLAYRKVGPRRRAGLLEGIAVELEQLRAELVALAHTETRLPEARLQGELTRTNNQLKMFAALIREGSWVEASIDTPGTAPGPGRPDLRKMLVPAGPVVIFGAANFPFAFSTAGGDTASALAAGATVVIKGHNAHPGTSLLIFGAMQRAVRATRMPEFTVQHLVAPGNAIGKALVVHPLTTGVGFTGSFSGGRALMDYAAGRQNPVPVFAEMSSVNPVVFYPGALDEKAESMATLFAGSLTLGAGQFCTNPGIMLGIDSSGFDRFIAALVAETAKTAAQPMLTTAIFEQFQLEKTSMLRQPGVAVAGNSFPGPKETEVTPVLAVVLGADFNGNEQLKKEVFGPFALLVKCRDREELTTALQTLRGQLTSTIMATAADMEEYADVVEIQQSMAGRILLNNAPTGVEVCASMVHGGPYPATTDARFTSVGTAAIKRWVRPVCLQNFFPAMLPEELKDANPAGILRLVNNEYTRAPVQHA